MTPLPKRKLSRRRQGKRRASIKLKLVRQAKCPNCGAIKLSHQICPQCGQYQGKQIVKIRVRKKEREDKA